MSGKPTIAVLPFEDRSGNPTQSYFSDGVTEDVIVDLGRFSSLLVLSWNAVAPYKGRDVPLEQLSRDLNVRYVVGGTVWWVGDRLRVTVQLTDTERGVLLWSERYDESLDDVLAVQDQIARQVVGTLAVRLTSLEQERVFEKPTDNMTAYDLVLRGRDLLRRVDRMASLEARAMFERARDLDPGYSDAYAGLTVSHTYDFMYGWSEWPQRAIEQAQDLAERAIRLNERNATAHAWLANALIYQGQFERAEPEIDRAIELNPNDAMSLAIRGVLMVQTGRPESAIPSLELAFRLDPNPVAWWVARLGVAYYLLGRYEDAVRLLERFKSRFGEDPGPFAVLAASQAQLGQRDLAAQTVSKVRRISPFFDADIVAGNLSNAEQAQHLLDGMRKAGFE